MKQGIHPQYYPAAKIKCACGNHWTTGSTKPELEIAICSACHPFYTGQEKILDTRGRVEKFKKRLEKTAQKAAASVANRRSPAARLAESKRAKVKAPKARAKKARAKKN